MGNSEDCYNRKSYRIDTNNTHHSNARGRGRGRAIHRDTPNKSSGNPRWCPPGTNRSQCGTAERTFERQSRIRRRGGCDSHQPLKLSNHSHLPGSPKQAFYLFVDKTFPRDTEILVHITKSIQNQPLDLAKTSKFVWQEQNQYFVAKTYIYHGHYYLYFLANQKPFVNNLYPSIFTEGGVTVNSINVIDMPLVNQIDSFQGISMNEAFGFQLDYYFGDDNYFKPDDEGSSGDFLYTKASENNNWVPFHYILEFNLLKKLANKYNVTLNAELLVDAAENSSVITADLEKGIKRINTSVKPGRDLLRRKVIIFPLSHTEDLFPLIQHLAFNGCSVSSFVAQHKQNCVRAEICFHSSVDALYLLSQGSIVFNGKHYLVRPWKKTFTEADASHQTQPPLSYTKSLAERFQDRQTASLPILAAYSEFHERLDSQQVTVCIAETGSGKTTQLPQYAAEYCKKKVGNRPFKVVCTQPRAIAALSLADRIAHEYDGVDPGENVGFEVGGKQITGREIVLMTDGCLIRKASSNMLLTDVNVLIIDEAHERSLDTDIVMAIAKLVCARRSDFKVIIASATIDPFVFLTYFYKSSAPHYTPLRVPGRLFRVEVEEKTLSPKL
ncbi:hypothetical protein P9112_012667 [Eukaryota sp. TZLM1-RC]